ncbi:MAG: helix-turn-helix transcriptional regulator [Clostridia bacterium]|nr:helix-turn-helix transcriptional regulator [Clostridia bacterium]
MAFTDYESFRILNIARIRRKGRKSNTVKRDWSSLGFRLSGESLFTYDGGQIRADAGSITYLPRSLSFRRESEGEEVIVVHLDCHEKENLGIESSDGTALRPIFEEMVTLWQNKASGYRHRCQALLHLALARLSEGEADRAQDVIRPAVLYLDQHFDDPSLTVETLSSLCCVTPEYFRRLYRRAYGTSPRRALVEKRLERACLLLQSGDYTVREASLLCGFSDAKYFCASFSRRFGIPPTAYKRKYVR